jgi:hypothetical protein
MRHASTYLRYISRHALKEGRGVPKVCVCVCVCECIPEVCEVAAPLPDAVANEHQRIYWLHIYLVYQ